MKTLTLRCSANLTEERPDAMPRASHACSLACIVCDKAPYPQAKVDGATLWHDLRR